MKENLTYIMWSQSLFIFTHTMIYYSIQFQHIDLPIDMVHSKSAKQQIDHAVFNEFADYTLYMYT